jgi:acyl-CoA synthetase (AMP-forming)/AMP-acid ligase II
MATRLRDLAAELGDQPALTDSSRSYTWTQLNETVNRVINGLTSLELGSERRIGVYAPNAANTLLVHVAGALAGVSVVPISFHLKADEVRFILEDSGAAGLFADGTTAGQARLAAGPDRVVVAWESDSPSITPWPRWLAESSPTEPLEDPQYVPNLIYTSGTTGRPRGTSPRLPPPKGRVSEVIPTFAGGAVALVGDAERRPHLVVSPLHHGGPLRFAVVSLLSGSNVVVTRRFDAEAILAAIDEHNIGTSVMVPTHLQRLLALPTDVHAKYDLSSLRYIGQTGAPCPIEVKRRAIELLGPVLVESYGSVESGIMCSINSTEWLEHPGSVGRCSPGITPVVVDEADEEVPPGQIGRLYFEDAAGHGLHYRNDPEKTAGAHLRPGVFTLGEIGYVDADGYVYITDRSKDMIVSGGVNIYPAESEEVLLEHAGVHDVAVIGVPDPYFGERALALVEPVDPANPPDVDELLALCRGRLAVYKCPRHIEFVESVGRNAMGKVNKAALRRPYWPSDRTIGG